MRYFKLLCLMVLVSSCDPPQEMLTPDAPSKMSLVNEVTNKTIIKLKAENALRACGVGSGMMDQIRMLAISFYYYNEVDINEARNLVVTACLEYLNAINSNKEIRQYLQNYPFEPKNIRIAIYITKPDGSDPDSGNLSIVTLSDGVLYYSVDRPGTMQLNTIFKETFEEAQEKVNVGLLLSGY